MTGQQCAIGPTALQVRNESEWSDLDWAPFPPAWPGVYACIVQRGPGISEWASLAGHEGPEEVPFVGLVDARHHKLLGSWTAADLDKYARISFPLTSLPWKPQALKWAPSGRHLAVLCPCRSKVLFLTFQTAG